MLFQRKRKFPDLLFFHLPYFPFIPELIALHEKRFFSSSIISLLKDPLVYISTAARPGKIEYSTKTHLTSVP